ncbi:MAG: hypothetical protein ACK56F_01040, partial [bacterium]
IMDCHLFNDHSFELYDYVIVGGEPVEHFVCVCVCVVFCGFCVAAPCEVTCAHIVDCKSWRQSRVDLAMSSIPEQCGAGKQATTPMHRIR